MLCKLFKSFATYIFLMQIIIFIKQGSGSGSYYFNDNNCLKDIKTNVMQNIEKFRKCCNKQCIYQTRIQGKINWGKTLMAISGATFFAAIIYIYYVNIYKNILSITTTTFMIE